MTEYEKAMKARQDREKAARIAEREQSKMRYSGKGDFTNLAPVSLNLRRG